MIDKDGFTWWARVTGVAFQDPGFYVIVGLNRMKNRANLTSRECRLLGACRYARFLWSVQTTNGCSIQPVPLMLANKRSSRSPKSEFLSISKRRWEKNAQGWSLPSEVWNNSPNLWIQSIHSYHERLRLNQRLKAGERLYNGLVGSGTPGSKSMPQL